jgi:hypothetical protein
MNRVLVYIHPDHQVRDRWDDVKWVAGDASARAGLVPHFVDWNSAENPGAYLGAIIGGNGARDDWPPQVPTATLVPSDRGAMPGELLRQSRGLSAPDVFVMWSDVQSRPVAVEILARWLDDLQDGDHSTAEELRPLLEIVGREVRSLIDSGALNQRDPIEIARALSAIETAEAQARSPVPSRKLIRLALAQLPGFVTGLLSSVAAQALSKLFGLA